MRRRAARVRRRSSPASGISWTPSPASRPSSSASVWMRRSLSGEDPTGSPSSIRTSICAAWIRDRKAKLLSGEAPAEDYLVPGSKAFIRKLQEAGIKCYLASGTDEEDVLYEAKLLGLDDAFAGGIHGAHAAMTECSKELVIRDMLEKEHIQPKELVSFGDGYVEVELVANLGGLAIGAATEEEKRTGINAWKRRRLIGAGAAAIIPDFRDSDEILKMIRG